MVGGDQRAVSRAPAPEHCEAEHGSKVIRAISFCANGNSENEDDMANTFETGRLFRFVSIHSGFGNAFFLVS